MRIRITPDNAHRYLERFGLRAKFGTIFVPSRNGHGRQVTACHLYGTGPAFESKPVSAGASICAPSDTYDKQYGQDIALGRALGAFLKQRYGKRPHDRIGLEREPITTGGLGDALREVHHQAD